MRRLARVVGLALALGAAVAWAGAAGLLRGAELRALDGLFVLRYRIHGSQALDPRIAVILLDERSFDRPDLGLRKPLAFWQEDLARLLEALGRAGASGVGFDLLVHPAVEDLPEVVQEELDRQALALQSAVRSQPVVLIEFDRGGSPGPGNGQSSPELHSVALDRGNAAFANLLTDPDGTVRRIPLYATPSGRTRTFSGRLAELATGKALSRDSQGRWSLGGRAVVTEDSGRALRVDHPGPLPHVLLSDLWPRILRGDPLPEFRGRICLVGGEGLLSQDLVSTPFSLLGRYTAGVDVQAAALNTLLTGRSVQPAPGWAWTLAILGLALGSALLAAFRPLAAGLCWEGLLLCGYGLFVLEAFRRTGTWLPSVAPGMAALLAFGAGYAERYLSVERGQALLRRLFSRYVSRQVAEDLLRDPRSLALGGIRRRVTVLFSDINDFTPACEERTPEEVISMLNRYFQEMQRIIDRHQGTLKQFVGDEIMVVYGAPQEQPDHAARAVLTGLEMLERLDELSRAEGSGFFDVKIGIHTGDVVAGNVGSTERTEWTVVGDDVNLAARIESETRKVGARLLVSAVARGEAEPLLPEVEWVSFGTRSFKGKTRTMDLFQPRRRGS